MPSSSSHASGTGLPNPQHSGEYEITVPTGWFEGVTGTGDYGGAVTGDVGML